MNHWRLSLFVCICLNVFTHEIAADPDHVRGQVNVILQGNWRKDAILNFYWP